MTRIRRIFADQINPFRSASIRKIRVIRVLFFLHRDKQGGLAPQAVDEVDALQVALQYVGPIGVHDALDLLELEVSAPDTCEARTIILRLLNVLTAVIRRPI